MVEVYDPVGKELLDLLLAVNPEWENGLEARTSLCPRLNIPSVHPTIKIPFTIELGGTLPCSWYGGYFFDFVDPRPASQAHEFLLHFFNEEILCEVCWRKGQVVAGGPVWDENSVSAGEYDLVELRSWRGTRDEDRVPT